jgi:tetratricopeptide (TPR) repeat protein
MNADLAELRIALERVGTETTAGELTRLIAQMSGLMCLTRCKTDSQAAARRWARTGRLAATETDDLVTLSWVLAQEAYVHYYDGDLPRAVEVAQHAQAVVPTRPCVGAVLAAALEARALATTGQHGDTRSALGKAEQILSQLTADEQRPSAFGYNEAQLRFHEGSAYTELGDTQLAEVAQDRALALCAPGDYTVWAMTRLDRAACLLLGGHAADGLAFATETLTELDDEQRRGIVTTRGRQILASVPQQVRRLPAATNLRDVLELTAAD